MMMRAFKSAAICVVLLVASQTATAAPIGYAVSSQELYTIDFNTGTAALVGNIGVGGFMESLALSPGGQLYGADTGGFLYSFDTVTGLATLIGDTALSNIEGLDFNGSTLVGADFNETTSLYAIDTATAAASLLATSSPGQGETRTMAIEDSNTALILTDSPTFQTLHAVNLTTGALTTRGTFTNGIYGIDFDGSTLYGVSVFGELYTINAATGAATLIGDTGDHQFLSLALIPGGAAEVPEPSSMVLLGLGGLGLVAARRRRQSA